jgi:hypothetical protein
VDVWAPICKGANLPAEQILGACPTAAAAAAAAAATAAAEMALAGDLSQQQQQQQFYSSRSYFPGSLWPNSNSMPVLNDMQQQYSPPCLSGTAAAAAAEVAAFEKGLKHRVMLAVEHFNKDHKKGFQFLQVRHGPVAWSGTHSMH